LPHSAETTTLTRNNVQIKESSSGFLSVVNISDTITINIEKAALIIPGIRSQYTGNDEGAFQYKGNCRSLIECPDNLPDPIPAF